GPAEPGRLLPCDGMCGGRRGCVSGADRRASRFRPSLCPVNPEGARSFRSAAELIADLWQHRKIERYEGRSSLRTWLATVVAHAAVNAGKAARTRARHAH